MTWPTREQLDAWHDEAIATCSPTGINRLHDVAVRALYELSLLPEAAQTIDTAPKDENGILAYSPTFYQSKGGWVAAVWLTDGWHANPGGWRFKPTHWLPLPPRPQRKEP